ncbi:MAG: acetyltransferase [Gammaproteobacteria bacterium 28-57-27]|nr:MAG: acetyltransferase [Gammaproteobacteria bacterium 28-57-27]
MYLKDNTSSDAVEILDIDGLINPSHSEVSARRHAGEELQEPENFSKSTLSFLSGEPLPRCWLDAHWHAI